MFKQNTMYVCTLHNSSMTEIQSRQFNHVFSQGKKIILYYFHITNKDLCYNTNSCTYIYNKTEANKNVHVGPFVQPLFEHTCCAIYPMSSLKSFSSLQYHWLVSSETLDRGRLNGRRFTIKGYLKYTYIIKLHNTLYFAIHDWWSMMLIDKK